MTDRVSIAHSLADVVTDAPDDITVADVEAGISKGWYWPISGDATTIRKAEEGAS